MNDDEDKIDEYMLALFYLVTHQRHEGFGARAWKGFDWDTMNRLYEKGYISNPIGKTKSVGMTADRGGRYRILSARVMTRHERRIYEEG